MIRGAFKTFVGAQNMHSMLVEGASESSCLSLAYSEMKPPGWDSPAFCSNLFHASIFSGLRHGSQYEVSLARVIYEWIAQSESLGFNLEAEVLPQSTKRDRSGVHFVFNRSQESPL